MEVSISRNPNPPAPRRGSPTPRRWVMPLSALAALAVWELVTRFGNIPEFLFPSPGRVWARLSLAVLDGTLLRNSAVTLLEVLLGLLAGATLATVIGYLLGKSRTLEQFLSPYLIASQAVPVVAIAPLLIIWFGPGLFSKVLICALTVFFPVLVNTLVGVRAVPQHLRDLMRSLRATPWQTLRHLEIPAVLPVFLGGLRVGATLSVIGAVVGELVGANRGLGFLINVGRGQFDTALVFVAVFALVLMALGLYGAVLLIEQRALRWRARSDRAEES